MGKRTSTTRVFQRITDSIKRQIVTGQLVPGEKLPAEREMARRRKVSRVSVRDAYRSLEELGVIAVRRGTGGGSYIAQPDRAAIQQSWSLMLRLGRLSDRELGDARMINSTVARLAARHARPQDITRLQRLLAREEAAVAHGRAVAPHRLRFERALLDCARNRALSALLHPLMDLTEEALAVSAAATADARICAAHRALVGAIERHDEHDASTLMREHIAWVQRTMAGPALTPGAPPRLPRRPPIPRRAA